MLTKRCYARSAPRGFTLLELLVVVAILAIIAGGLVVAYEGLEGKAAGSVSTFNIKGVDQAIRQYAAVNRTSPDGWDSLMFSTTGSHSSASLLPLLTSELKSTTTGLLTPYSLSEDEANALNAGMQQPNSSDSPKIWYVSSTVSNSALGSYPTSPAVPNSPNRVFDAPLTGWGLPLALSEGAMVARVNPATVRGSTVLTNVLKFDTDAVVVAFGLGYNASLIKPEHGGVGMSEAPFDGGVPQGSYGRFIVLFHLGSTGDIEQKAHVVGVLDARGNYFDAAHALATSPGGE